MTTFYELGWPNYRKARPIFTDFVGQEWHTVRARVIGKSEEHSILKSVGPLSGGITRFVAYIVLVTTSGGLEVQAEVSEEIYKLINLRDILLVRYRSGRWTGALRGRLAR